MKSALALFKLNIPAITNYSKTVVKNPEFAETFVQAIEQSADPICLTDRKGVIEYANKAFKRVSGYSQKEVIGCTLLMLGSKRQSRKHSKNIWKALFSGNAYRNEVVNHTKEGQIFYVDETLTPIKDSKGNVCCMMCIWKDITQYKRNESKIYRQAMYDPLTKLPNRRLLYDRLDMAIAKASRSGKKMAVLYLDLDKFKPINDIYGHKTGDAVLKEVAQRLRESVRSSDTVARIGGDEFIIILENIHSSMQAESIAELLRQKILVPINVKDRKVQIDSSIGIATYPLHGGNTESVINKADALMRYQKSQRKISQIK